MGYYSNVMIAVTKKDFEKIESKQKKIPYNILLDDIKVDEYVENGRECVFAHFGYVKYNEEFEEVQVLEKSLEELEDGYIFLRLGEQFPDVDFRNRTKISELMKEFEFLRELRDSITKELKEEKESAEEEEEFE